jgi:hypothetical protein
MKIEKNWKIRLDQLLAENHEAQTLSVEVNGRQVRISLDGKNWLNMGAVVAPIGFPQQSSITFDEPMLWNEKTQQVVPPR